MPLMFERMTFKEKNTRLLPHVYFICNTHCEGTAD